MYENERNEKPFYFNLIVLIAMKGSMNNIKVNRRIKSEQKEISFFNVLDMLFCREFCHISKF